MFDKHYLSPIYYSDAFKNVVADDFTFPLTCLLIPVFSCLAIFANSRMNAGNGKIHNGNEAKLYDTSYMLISAEASVASAFTMSGLRRRSEERQT